MFLYLLKIVTISDFSSVPSNSYLSTRFQKIVTILFWYGKKILAQVFFRQVYAPIKQTLSIDDIVH